MGLRRWVRRLERGAGPLHGTLRLPDGTEIHYEREEMLDTLLATIDGREHRLLPYLRQIPTEEGMPGMIRALEGTSERAS
jgi:hypothetical protein